MMMMMMMMMTMMRYRTSKITRQLHVQTARHTKYDNFYKWWPQKVRRLFDCSHL